MKIFIAGGAGTLGSCIAQALAANALADEIVLYDVNRGLAANHAMDLLESVCLTSTTDVRVGAIADMRGSDIVIPVVSVGGNDYIKTMEQTVPVLLELVTQVESLTPDAVVITASNPVDVLNSLFFQRTGLPSSRWLGVSYNDTIRFRRALGLVLKAPLSRITAFTIGEHGAAKVPVFSRVEIDGKPFVLDSEHKEAILKEMDQWWDSYVNHTTRQRTAGWTTAFSVAEMIRRIRGLEDSPITCSCVLNGQYGKTGVSVGVPVRLNKHGVAEIIELALDMDEKAAFEASVTKIYKQTQEGFSALWGAADSAHRKVKSEKS